MMHNSFRILHLLAVPALLLWTGCTADSDPVSPEPVPLPDLTLLALGDSYTVGHSLPQEWSWPFQLADSLAFSGDTLQTLDVIAQTGWTTRDLLDALRDSLAGVSPERPPYGLVTLMIGVNNQFQGVDLDVFQAEMDTLADLAINLAGDRAEQVLGFSIPDYGVTPVGGLFNPEQISEGIRTHNLILGQVLADKGVALLDITTVSLQAADNPSLVARDGLHFSREMYRLWVDLMLPDVRHCLALDIHH